MKTGNLQGLINSTEQIIFDYEVTGSPVSSISTGNILNGDEDGWYTIIYRYISNGTQSYTYLRLNGDSGNNYGYRGIRAYGTLFNSLGWTDAGMSLGSGDTDSGTTHFSVSKLYAKSGSFRMMNTQEADGIIGTTVFMAKTTGQVWANTVDNIISMLFTPGVGTYAIGTRIIILKSNNFTGGTKAGTITTPYIKGSWVRVRSQILTETATSVNFTGLNGDRDVIYYLSTQSKWIGGEGGAYLKFNSDVGSNYGYQWLRRIGPPDSLIDANRGTTIAIATSLSSYGDNGYGAWNALIFAKKGFVRPVLVNSNIVTTGTSITESSLIGTDWNNTVDNIISLNIYANVGSIAAGSQFELYALRPAG